jgi:cytochrome c peroxidase
MNPNGKGRTTGGWRRLRHMRLALVLASIAMFMLTGRTVADKIDPNLQPFNDASGQTQTFSTSGTFDTTNPFFQSLGTNARTCATCHVVSEGMTITPAGVQARFNATGGTDPIFRTNDGSNSPDADVSTVAARQAAYSMLLTKGLIRIGIGIPASGEFSLIGVDDPYGYASAKELSLFRRPLPATNLPFLSAVMWDGRETVQPITGPLSLSNQALQADLMHQAVDATLGHAQATSAPTLQQQQQIVAFETQLYSAQIKDQSAGNLATDGALGGPQNLSNQPFYVGINDVLGGDPTGAAFNPNAMTLYGMWSLLTGSDPDTLTRQSVARGEAIFNSRQFQITGVAGLNDKLQQASITGTCTTCHDTPNVGNHSVAAPLNIGTADPPLSHSGLNTDGLPLYTLQNNTTGATVQTTDPGRALITGKWADIGKFKGPILRNLAARAPYFHNGAGTTLEDVVTFYNARFNIGLSDQDKADLVAFLKTL